MKKEARTTTDGIAILYREFYQGKPDRIADLEKAKVEDEIARKIYDLRTKAGLSQRALAKMIGTTASVICRLEGADYDGHSLSMLNRIAAALNKRVEINFVPLRGKARKKSVPA